MFGKVFQLIVTDYFILPSQRIATLWIVFYQKALLWAVTTVDELLEASLIQWASWMKGIVTWDKEFSFGTNEILVVCELSMEKLEKIIGECEFCVLMYIMYVQMRWFVGCLNEVRGRLRDFNNVMPSQQIYIIT